VNNYIAARGGVGFELSVSLGRNEGVESLKVAPGVSGGIFNLKMGVFALKANFGWHNRA
jgi:hypothetical protein